MVLKPGQVCCTIRHNSLSPYEVRADKNREIKCSPVSLVLTFLVLPYTAETKPNKMCELWDVAFILSEAQTRHDRAFAFSRSLGIRKLHALY